MRLAQTVLNLLPPVIHACDDLSVEEDPQIAPGKCSEGGLNLGIKFGYLAAVVVRAGIADKQVVGHLGGSSLAETQFRLSTRYKSPFRRQNAEETDIRPRSGDTTNL